MTRPAPVDAESKRLEWRSYALVWQLGHYLIGFTSATLSVLIATNTQLHFLRTDEATLLAGIAAGLTFLLTTLRAEIRGITFEKAARLVEAAILRYRYDESIPETYIAEALQRGIEILDIA
jgi:hypothetical protein